MTFSSSNFKQKNTFIFPILPCFFRAVIQAWTTDDRRDRQKAFGCRSSHNWWSAVLPKLPPVFLSVASVVGRLFHSRALMRARETYDVYWSVRGGSVPVGLFCRSSVVFQAQTIELGLLVWAMCIYSPLFTCPFTF